jgi:hypothetical protein
LLLLLLLLPLRSTQVAYFVTCRFLKTSTFHPRVFRGNSMIYISVPVTISLMVSLCQHCALPACGTQTSQAATASSAGTNLQLMH